LELTERRVLFDRGTTEIFANGGSACGSRRSYKTVDPIRVTIGASERTAIRSYEALVLTL
jgi:hypothetical protein